MSRCTLPVSEPFGRISWWFDISPRNLALVKMFHTLQVMLLWLANVNYTTNVCKQFKTSPVAVSNGHYLLGPKARVTLSSYGKNQLPKFPFNTLPASSLFQMFAMKQTLKKSSAISLQLGNLNSVTHVYGGMRTGPKRKMIATSTLRATCWNILGY